MATGIIGYKSWGQISRITGSSEQGWTITSTGMGSPGSGTAYIVLNAPCGGSAKMYPGDTANLGGVLVKYFGLYDYCNGSSGCFSTTYKKVSIPAGRCPIYGDIPTPPQVYEGGDPVPPMDITRLPTPECFNYFKDHNERWRGTVYFTAYDFFDEPKSK